MYFSIEEAGSFRSNRGSTRRGTRSYVSHTSLKTQDGRKKL